MVVFSNLNRVTYGTSYSLAHLGMPISNRMLTIADFDPIVERVAARVEPWQGKLLASGGRLTLVNDCLTNIPIYLMGFYLLQDGAHDKMDRVRSHFFW